MNLTETFASLLDHCILSLVLPGIIKVQTIKSKESLEERTVYNGSGYFGTGNEYCKCLFSRQEPKGRQKMLQVSGQNNVGS